MLHQNGKSFEFKLTQNCLQKGPSTSIVDPATGKDRPFTFDYSFWSFDEFEDVNGYMTPIKGGNYADQQIAYEALGKQVLDNAW